MALTKRSDYGLRAALELAAHYDRGPLSAGRIAERGGLPEPFVKKLLQRLASAGIAQAVRGRGGGYSLSKRPEQVPLSGVLEAFEELAPVSCLQQASQPQPRARHKAPGSVSSSCAVEPEEADCPTRIAWELVDRRVRAVLETITLADLLEEVRARGLTLGRPVHA